MKEEIIKQYKDTRYSVSNLGVVYSDTAGELKPICIWKANTGYSKCRFHDKGIKTDMYVHRLVAELFCENPEGRKIVMHIDGIKTNNNADNLCWGTNKENTQQGYDDNAYKFKARAHKVKAVHKDTGEVMVFKSLRELESVLSYNRKTVTAILKGDKAVNNFKHDFYYDM